MAYRRGLITRAKLFSQQRFSPSFSYIHRQDDREKPLSLSEEPRFSNFLQSRSFQSSINTSLGFGTLFQDRRGWQFVVPIANGSFFARHMSTTIGEGGMLTTIGEGADKFDYITDVANTTVEAVASQAPAMSEVAIAAADSFFPVAALQYLIDGVHNFTGFNWWASIVVTTLLIRGLTVPLMINQLKATTKLTLMRPDLEAIKQEMQDRGMSPTAVTEGQQQMAKIFKEYGVTPWTPLKGILIQGPVFISFFLAIQNMVDKVPSLKGGGALWFTDLTTPDSLYIFPVLTALSFWITVECNMQEGLEGNPAAGTMKNVARVFAVLAVPMTMSFPKAIFCYWVTSNFYSLLYGLVIKTPGVKQFLGVPEIPVARPTTAAPQPAFSFFEAIKKYAAAQQSQTASSSVESSKPSSVESSKPVSQRISSSSVISQRLKSLEKEVKGRKKGKKR